MVIKIKQASHFPLSPDPFTLSVGLTWRRRWHPTPVLLPGKSHGWRSLVGYSPWGLEESDMTERLHFHFSFHALEKEMATHSSVLAWRIPGTGEPGRLPSMGSHRVGHDWSDLAAAAAGISLTRGNRFPIKITLPTFWKFPGDRANCRKKRRSDLGW